VVLILCAGALLVQSLCKLVVAQWIESSQSPGAESRRLAARRILERRPARLGKTTLSFLLAVWALAACVLLLIAPPPTGAYQWPQMVVAFALLFLADAAYLVKRVFRTIERENGA